MAGYQRSDRGLSVRSGFAIWFTGLPASGKTTIARAVQAMLAADGVRAIVLDSDELRVMLTPTPTYTAAERDWLYGVVASLAHWLTENGINVLIAATAHRRAYRDAARATIQRFAEVELRCPVAVCQQRDPRGLYARAARDEITTLPGLDLPFEPPSMPEATIDTARCSPDQAASLVLKQLAGLIRES